MQLAPIIQQALLAETEELDLAHAQQPGGLLLLRPGGCEGCQNKPTALRSALEELGSRIGTAASLGTVVIELEQDGSRALGSRMPRQAAGGTGLTLGSARSGCPARMGRRPGCTCIPLGQAPRDRRRQRPPRPRCLIPCHAVSPVALPGSADRVAATCFATRLKRQKPSP